ncbi:unnamed protein product [Coregonus sp. 'balchen']|nr:unnamed protein product [Coregonus sp. 'balchen']
MCPISIKYGVKPGPGSKMEHTLQRPPRELPDLSVLRVSEVYKDFHIETAPLITTMGINSEVPLVNSAFGKVQA